LPIYQRVIAISNGFTARLLKDPWVLLCTGFGVGFLPRVPGTWGSLLGIGLWWVVFHELGPAVSILVVVSRLALRGSLSGKPAVRTTLRTNPRLSLMRLSASGLRCYGFRDRYGLSAWLFCYFDFLTLPSRGLCRGQIGRFVDRSEYCSMT